MIAPGIPGGWSYVRVETQNAYEGVVHTTNRTLSLTLFATLFVAVLSTLGLAYRGEMQRRRADERFRALVQHAPDMTALVDAQGRISYASPSAGSLLAVGAEPLAGRPLADAVHPDDRSVIQSVIDSVRQQRSGVKRVQCRVPDGDHAVRWLEFTASNQSGHSALGGVVINARDVTENRVLHEQLAHDAQHDTLTGLPNRRRMSTVMESLLRKEAVAVLFVDLDGFKPVNDVYGHAAGDELLRQVAYRVGRCIRGEDLLARVGGDEFVVLMPGVTRSDAEVAAARIQVAFDHPFQVMGAEVSVGASMGIHHATAASDPEQALREADKAMYKIKQARGAQRVRYAKDAS
jgi:diguanylate cyclase (GGDEF)-like protein/PAS domain S-box-containing protein